MISFVMVVYSTYVSIGYSFATTYPLYSAWDFNFLWTILTWGITLILSI